MSFTDYNFWFFVLTSVLLIAVVVAAASFIFNIIKSDLSVLSKILWSFLIAVVISIIIAVRFMSFGPGIQTVPTPEEEEGINKMMEDFPDEDIKKADENVDKKIPDVLKQVRKNSQEDEDEKFKKALENALKNK